MADNTSSNNWLRPSEAAELIGVSVQTLAHWRCRGCGPIFTRAGSRDIRYRRSDLEAFMTEREARSTHERNSNP